MTYTTERKLKCVVVDDDPNIHSTIDALLKDNPIADVVAKFLCPKEFLETESNIDFDVCLLDVIMPHMTGFTVAEILEKRNKKVIFICGVEEKLLEAIEMDVPFDVVPKPISKQRLFATLQKTHQILIKEKSQIEKNELFSVAEIDSKIRIKSSDIAYVKTDNNERRHKNIILKNNLRYKIMHCTLNKLLSFSPALIQVNKAELISLDVFKGITGDTIILDNIQEADKHKYVVLSRRYRSDFKKRVGIN